MKNKKKRNQKKEIRKRIERLRRQLPESQKCSVEGCLKPIFEIFVSADTEPYEIGGKPVCREHYFKEIGDEVEKHPIGCFPKRF